MNSEWMLEKDTDYFFKWNARISPSPTPPEFLRLFCAATVAYDFLKKFHKVMFYNQEMSQGNMVLFKIVSYFKADLKKM